MYKVPTSLIRSLPIFPLLYIPFVVLISITGPSSEIWLGLTPHNNTMKWQSTGEIVSTTNWVNREIETSEFSVDSAVVMNGSSDWSWELVSQSTSAHVVCQRGKSSQQTSKKNVDDREVKKLGEKKG